MTIREMTKQVFDLCGGKINGEQRTYSSFLRQVQIIFHGENAGKKITFTMELPDGEWFFEMIKVDDHLYDYYLPETRGQEKRMIEDLYNRANKKGDSK